MAQESLFFPPGMPPLALNSRPGADPGNTLLVQRAAQRLIKVMGDPNVPKGQREQAKIALDHLKRQAERLNLEFVAVQPDAPPDSAAVPGPLGLVQTPVPPDQRAAAVDRMAATAPETGQVGIPPDAPASTGSALGTILRGLAEGARSVSPLAAEVAGRSGGQPSELPIPLVSPRGGRGSASSPGDSSAVPDSEPPPVLRAEGAAAAEAGEPSETSAFMPEGSPELDELRRLMAEPEPKYRGRKQQFNKIEGIALAFLTGLKGIQAALPFIEMREREARFEFESEVQARRERIAGMTALTQIAESVRSRREMQQMRAAQNEWNRYMRMMDMQFRERDFLFRADAENWRREWAARKFAVPPANITSDIILAGNILNAAKELRPLVAAGAGGPVFGRDFLRAVVPEDTKKAAALWGRMKLLFGPNYVGKQATLTEIGGLGANVLTEDIASMKGKQLNAIDQIIAAAENDLRGLSGRFDPELVYRMANQPMPGSALMPTVNEAIPPVPPGLIPMEPGPGSPYHLLDDSEID